MIDDKNKKINKQTGDKKVIQEFNANKSETSKWISKLETCTSLVQVFNDRDVKIETKGKLKAETMDKFDYAKLGEMINTSIDNAITNKVVPMINTSINEAITNKIVPMIDKSIDNAINNKVVPMIEDVKHNMNERFEQLEVDNKFIKSKIETLEEDNKFIKNEIIIIKNDIQKIKECPTIKKELAE